MQTTEQQLIEFWQAVLKQYPELSADLITVAQTHEVETPPIAFTPLEILLPPEITRPYTPDWVTSIPPPIASPQNEKIILSTPSLVTNNYEQLSFNHTHFDTTLVNTDDHVQNIVHLLDSINLKLEELESRLEKVDEKLKEKKAQQERESSGLVQSLIQNLGSAAGGALLLGGAALAGAADMIFGPSSEATKPDNLLQPILPEQSTQPAEAMIEASQLAPPESATIQPEPVTFRNNIFSESIPTADAAQLPPQPTTEEQGIEVTRLDSIEPITPLATTFTPSTMFPLRAAPATPMPTVTTIMSPAPQELPFEIDSPEALPASRLSPDLDTNEDLEQSLIRPSLGTELADRPESPPVDISSIFQPQVSELSSPVLINTPAEVIESSPPLKIKSPQFGGDLKVDFIVNPAYWDPNIYMWTHS